MSTPSIRRCSDMYRMLAYLIDLYDITPERYRPYLLSFIENETDKTIEDGLNQIINSEYAQGLLERRFDLNKVNCFCLAFLGKKVKVGFKEFKP